MAFSCLNIIKQNVGSLSTRDYKILWFLVDKKYCYEWLKYKDKKKKYLDFHPCG